MADENLTLAQDINDYPMQHAGEEIDEILSRARQDTLWHCGIQDDESESIDADTAWTDLCA